MAERLGEVENAGTRGTGRDQSRLRPLGQERVGADDRGRTRRLQIVHKRAGRVEDGEELQVELITPVLVCDVVEPAAPRLTGIVHQNVDAAEPVDDLFAKCRDLIGFVDGTENPQGDDDRTAVALVADGSFAGGSYINIQRYVHDLPKWNGLKVKDQEDIIARTKDDNVEYKTEDKPPFAHIKRVSIKEDGKSLEMLRHSMPYGTADEHGLYFVAYTGRPDTFPRMLEEMIVADGDGNYDHLMDFTRAVTGCTFFAPAEDWLAANV